MPCLIWDLCLLEMEEHWDLHVGHYEAMKGDAVRSLAESVARSGGNLSQEKATDKNSPRARWAAWHTEEDDAAEREEVLGVRWEAVAGWRDV